MPAIAKAAISNAAYFYWHLGDFRAIYRIDQDYAQEHKPASRSPAISIADYLINAWPDFISNQLQPFGQLPVYLSLGNHELIPPKTRDQLVVQFADWLNSPTIREQRLQDDPNDHTVRTYYHWISDGIDFVTLDNSSDEQFDDGQMQWIRGVLNRDAAGASVRAVVVGMHEALPDSISSDHSMNQFPRGTESGRQVYQWLVDFRNSTKKPIYVLASHSHFYMDGVFNSAAIRQRGDVLPGWIIGTAGAERYPLPPESGSAKAALTHVYGYLLATVGADRENPIRFEFREVTRGAVPMDLVQRFGAELVDRCYQENAQNCRAAADQPASSKPPLGCDIPDAWSS